MQDVGQNGPVAEDDDQERQDVDLQGVQCRVEQDVLSRVSSAALYWQSDALTVPFENRMRRFAKRVYLKKRVNAAGKPTNMESLSTLRSPKLVGCGSMCKNSFRNDTLLGKYACTSDPVVRFTPIFGPHVPASAS